MLGRLGRVFESLRHCRSRNKGHYPAFGPTGFFWSLLSVPLRDFLNIPVGVLSGDYIW
jgi:hypothetical protein